MRTWLSEIRKQHGLTQEEVAQAAKTTISTYWCIEQGRRTPRYSTAKRIAKALEFDWTKFYEQ